VTERPKRTVFPNSRVLWLAWRAPFESRRARLRGCWHIVVRGYAYEICMACGRPVGPRTGSWWAAPDVLWKRVIGDRHGVVCPPCFTRKAADKGIVVSWRAVEDV
jgi:hypothetical protein